MRLRKAFFAMNGISIYLGSYEEKEARHKELQAKELREKWQHQKGLSKEWMTKELEKRNIRLVSKKYKLNNSSTTSGNIYTRSELKNVVVNWQGMSLYIGRYPVAEANEKINTARAFIGKWRQKSPLPSKEWVETELKLKFKKTTISSQQKKNVSSSAKSGKIVHDDTLNITSKFLKKQKDSLCGIWILDRTLGSPSMRGCLEAMKLPNETINSHIEKNEEMDVMCHINLYEDHYKIRSFYIQDIDNPPRVMSLPLGEEIVERFGGKRTLVTSKHPKHVEMKISMMTVSGFTECWDTKEIVSFKDIELPTDFAERPERIMRQTVKLKNHESGKSDSLIRYYLSVDP